MRLVSIALLALLQIGPALAGDAEVRAAQSVVDAQIKALLADDGPGAYQHAAPNVKLMFPSVEAFMGMVTNGYPPVRRPSNYAFGKSQEMSATSIVQQVMIVGPDGKDYEAVYTLALQPDGTWKITGCSLRAASSLST